MACSRPGRIGQAIETLEECAVARRSNFEGNASNIERPSLACYLSLLLASLPALSRDGLTVKSQTVADFIKTCTTVVGIDELGIVNGVEGSMQQLGLGPVMQICLLVKICR